MTTENKKDGMVGVLEALEKTGKLDEIKQAIRNERIERDMRTLKRHRR